MCEPKYETGHQMWIYPKPVRVLLLGAMPVLFLFSLSMTLIYTYICIFVEPPVNISYLLHYIFCFILDAGFTSFCFYYGWCVWKGCLARYRFLKEGLMVKYPLEEEFLIPWNEFQQVCFIYSNFAARGRQAATSDICCVRKGERKNLYGRWKSDNAFHYKTVIAISFKPEYLAGIREVCPYQVPDLRGTGNYRL